MNHFNPVYTHLLFVTPNILTVVIKDEGIYFKAGLDPLLLKMGVLEKAYTIHSLKSLEAGLVKEPQDFIWSSYRAYLERDYYMWLETDAILRRFGVSREIAIQQLIEFTHRKVDGISDVDLITKAFRKGAFGCEEFCTGINVRQESFLKNSEIDVSLEDVLTNVCNKFQVTLEELRSPSKEKKVVAARSTIAIITRKANKWPLEDVARLLNKNSGTISRLASQARQQVDSREFNIQE